SGTWPQLRLVQHDRNRGRGQAIRTGAAAAQGALVMYADADGATPIAEERKLRAAIQAGADIAIGSRDGASKGVSRCRDARRKFIGKMFATLVRVVIGPGVRDTQCGFKMWRREVGVHILECCQEQHWLLDVEMLAVAQR